MQEVDGLAVDLGAELRVRVEFGLLGAPVEAVGPVIGELPQVFDRHAALPRCAGQLFGPARRGQPALQIGQVVVGYRDAEGLEGQLCGHPAIIRHAVAEIEAADNERGM